MNKTYHNLSAFASTPLRAHLLALQLFDSTILIQPHTHNSINISNCVVHTIVFVFSLQITADFYEKEDIDNNDDNNNNHNNDGKPTFEPFHIHIHEYRIRYENAFEMCSTNEYFSNWIDNWHIESCFTFKSVDKILCEIKTKSVWFDLTRLGSERLGSVRLNFWFDFNGFP